MQLLIIKSVSGRGLAMDISRIFAKGKVWTIPNILSLIRLGFAFLLYYFILKHQTPAAVVTSLVSMATDFADGYLARKLNEITELGKILDPMGDKIIVGLAAIGLYQSYGLPLWILLVIIGRDVLILIGSFFLFKRMRQVTASNTPGKIAVTVIAFLLLSYLFEFTALQIPLQVLAVTAIVLSFFYYFNKFIRMLQQNRVQ